MTPVVPIVPLAAGLEWHIGAHSAMLLGPDGAICANVMWFGRWRNSLWLAVGAACAVSCLINPQPEPPGNDGASDNGNTPTGTGGGAFNVGPGGSPSNASGAGVAAGGANSSTTGMAGLGGRASTGGAASAAMGGASVNYGGATAVTAGGSAANDAGSSTGASSGCATEAGMDADIGCQ